MNLSWHFLTCWIGLNRCQVHSISWQKGTKLPTKVWKTLEIDFFQLFQKRPLEIGWFMEVNSQLKCEVNAYHPGLQNGGNPGLALRKGFFLNNHTPCHVARVAERAATATPSSEARGQKLVSPKQKPGNLLTLEAKLYGIWHEQFYYK